MEAPRQDRAKRKGAKRQKRDVVRRWPRCTKGSGSSDGCGLLQVPAQRQGPQHSKQQPSQRRKVLAHRWVQLQTRRPQKDEEGDDDGDALAKVIPGLCRCRLVVLARAAVISIEESIAYAIGRIRRLARGMSDREAAPSHEDGPEPQIIVRQPHAAGSALPLQKNDHRAHVPLGKKRSRRQKLRNTCNRGSIEACVSVDSDRIRRRHCVFFHVTHFLEKK